MAEQKTVGSTWIAEYHHNIWPVVLCDEETAAPMFMSSRSKPHHSPAILLGRHKYIWVNADDLQEWDPNRDYLTGLKSFKESDIQEGDDSDVIMEKQRRTAFRQDIELVKDHKYWHNYIVNQSEARKADLQRRNKGSVSSWSDRNTRTSGSEPSTPRRGTAASTNKKFFAPSIDNYMGAWNPALKATAPRRKKREDDNLTIIEVGRPPPRRQTKAAKTTTKRQRSSTPEESPTARKNQRRTNTRPVIIEDDSETEGEPEVVIVKATTIAKSPTASSQDIESAHPKQVKLLFKDEDVETFVLIPRRALRECKYLINRENYSTEHNCHIVPLWSDSRAIERGLTEKEMQLLVPYFETGDIGPVFRDDKSSKHPFGRMGSELKGDHVELLGKAFIVASKISHITLQELIIEKLKALSPLPSMALLSLVVICARLTKPENSPELELCPWIVEHLVHSYGKLMLEHSTSLKRLLEENAPLGRMVREGMAKAAEEENSDCQDEAVPARKEGAVK